MRRLKLQFGLLFIAAACWGCGSPQISANTGNTAEMLRVQQALEDLQKSINLGDSKQAFAKKVDDTLAKIGDLQNSQKTSEAGLPADKVALVYQYFGQAASAYNMAKEFYGVGRDEILQTDTDATSVEEQQVVGYAFPEVFPVDRLSREKTLQDLLRLAQNETSNAAAMIQAIQNLKE